jgi:glucose dehydrogenase
VQFEEARMRRSSVGVAAVAVLATAAALGIEAQPRSAAGQWRSVGGDAAFTRYSALDQITKANVKTLKIAWRQPGYDPALKTQFPELRVSGNYRSTPIMVDGVMYAPNAVGLVRAFGPGSGEIRW